MDLRRIIKEELADFEWMGEIQPETDLEPGQLWLRYEGIDQHNALFFASEIVPRFGDLSLEGDGSVVLYTESFCYFTDLFVDNDSSRYAYVNRTLAEAIFCKDDYFEPYYDVVYDWGNQVWDLVGDDPEIYQHIVNHIKEGEYVGQELSTSDEFDDPDNEGFRLDMLDDIDLMGELIETDDLFSDLKRELTWAYESSYNVAASDSIYDSTKGAITDIFGEGEWEPYQVQKMDGPLTRYRLKFDITDLFFEKIEEYFSECFDNCRRYFDPSKYEYRDEDDYYSNEEEAFEEFCEECWEPQHGDFIDMLAEMLYEGNELLNPSFDEYPSDNQIIGYFKEDLYGRI
jgi:hypothetical protein